MNTYETTNNYVAKSYKRQEKTSEEPIFPAAEHMFDHYDTEGTEDKGDVYVTGPMFPDKE